MSFVSLMKYGYQHPQFLSEEVTRRKSSPATISLKFDNGKYFYVLIPELICKLEEVLQTERILIPNLIGALQTDALEYVKFSMLIREIRSTHQIEGVHSSRKEIEESAVAPKKRKTVKRFSEFFKVLSELFEIQNSTQISTLTEIRSLYDRVTAGEIEPNTDLDGALFRREAVYVRSESQKILHTGFLPEAKIFTGLEHMLEQANDPVSPQLFNALLCHFMFETVHPFYDGNGRTGRVLLAHHLVPLLSELTILSLSQAISVDKNLYYSSLKDARDSRNHGELTGFLLNMLTLIEKAQLSVVRDLEYAQSLIKIFKSTLSTLDFSEPGFIGKDKMYREILLQIGLHYIFGTSLGLSLAELVTSMPTKISEQTLRKYCLELVDVGFLKLTTKRPARFTLTESAAEQLNIPEQLFQ